MEKIIKWKKTCMACPVQYDLWTDIGNYIYFRYRYGRISIELEHKIIYERTIGGSLDGYMPVDQVIQHLGEAGFDTSQMILSEKTKPTNRQIACIGDISCNNKITNHIPIIMGPMIWWKCSLCGNYSLKEELHNHET